MRSWALVRVISAVLVLSMLITDCPTSLALAEGMSASRTIVIIVADAETGRPVRATVTVDGKPPVATAANGYAVISAPSTSSAIIVRADGYGEVRLSADQIWASQRIALKRIAQIGRVTAPSSAARDQAVTLDRSLVDALSSIATVNVAPDSSKLNAALSISIAGRDESQTAVKILGVKVAGGASTPVLRAIPPDLLSSITVDFTANPVSPAGTVEFQTVEPSKIRSNNTIVSYGSLDRLRYATTGTVGGGAFALAYGHSWRGGGAPINGLTFVDQSGADYSHAADVHQATDFVRGNLRVSNATNVVFGALASDSRSSNACTEVVALVPCSVGPGSREDESFRLGTITLRTSAGKNDLAITASGWSDRDIGFGTTDLHGTEDVVDRISQRSFQFAGSRKLGRHSLLATWERTEVSEMTFARSSAASSLVRAFERVNDIALEDRLNLLNGLSATARIHHVTLTGVSPTLTGEIGLTKNVGSSWTYAASAYSGSAVPSYNLQRPLSDPTFVSIACNAATLLRGPGDVDGKQRLVGVRTSIANTVERRSVTLSASYERQGGQTLNLSVPLMNEPAGYLPSDYVPLLESQWHRSDHCGSLPFDANKFFVIEPIASTTRDYLSLSSTVRILLSSRFTLSTSIAYNSARMSHTGDPRLAGPFSQFFDGRQLVSRPPLRASLSLLTTDRTDRSNVLITAQYTDANNLRRLGSYATVGIAASRTVGRGRLTLAAPNMLNADTGRFSTLIDSYATPLRGGTSILRPTQPLEPRQLNLSYTVRTRANASSKP